MAHIEELPDGAAPVDSAAESSKAAQAVAPGGAAKQQPQPTASISADQRPHTHIIRINPAAHTAKVVTPPLPERAADSLNGLVGENKPSTAAVSNSDAPPKDALSSGPTSQQSQPPTNQGNGETSKMGETGRQTTLKSIPLKSPEQPTVPLTGYAVPSSNSGQEKSSQSHQSSVKTENVPNSNQTQTQKVPTPTSQPATTSSTFTKSPTASVQPSLASTLPSSAAFPNPPSQQQQQPAIPAFRQAPAIPGNSNFSSVNFEFPRLSKTSNAGGGFMQSSGPADGFAQFNAQRTAMRGAAPVLSKPPRQALPEQPKQHRPSASIDRKSTDRPGQMPARISPTAHQRPLSTGSHSQAFPHSQGFHWSTQSSPHQQPPPTNNMNSKMGHSHHASLGHQSSMKHPVPPPQSMQQMDLRMQGQQNSANPPKSYFVADPQRDSETAARAQFPAHAKRPSGTLGNLPISATPNANSALPYNSPVGTPSHTAQIEHDAYLNSRKRKRPEQLQGMETQQTGAIDRPPAQPHPFTPGKTSGSLESVTRTEQPANGSLIPAKPKTPPPKAPKLGDIDFNVDFYSPALLSVRTSITLPPSTARLGTFTWDPNIPAARLLNGELLANNVGGNIRVIFDTKWLGGIAWSLPADSTKADNSSLTTMSRFHELPPIKDHALWGTDIYTDDSDPVLMAIHSGLLTLGGQISEKQPATLAIDLQVLPRLINYQGCARAGIHSKSWGNGHDGVSLTVKGVSLHATSSHRQQHRTSAKRVKVIHDLANNDLPPDLSERYVLPWPGISA